MKLEDLPGAELVLAGLSDLAGGRLDTLDGLLVAIGAPRLRWCGLVLPDELPEEPELRLYERLAELHGDEAHSRYNALIGRLVSFERALELRRRVGDWDKEERGILETGSPAGSAQSGHRGDRA